MPVAENHPKPVLRLAGTLRGCKTDAAACPGTGTASAEPGSSRKPDAESVDARKGYAVGRWLARRLMQKCGLEIRQPGIHRYRGVKEEAAVSPNLLKRRLTPEAPDRVWSGDISYVRVNGGWCYLALVIDLYPRRIVGSAVSSSPDAELVCQALRRALESRSCRTGRLLCHSDQGGQYRSKKYRQLLWRHGGDAEHEPEREQPG